MLFDFRDDLQSNLGVFEEVRQAKFIVLSLCSLQGKGVQKTRIMSTEV